MNISTNTQFEPGGAGSIIPPSSLIRPSAERVEATIHIWPVPTCRASFSAAADDGMTVAGGSVGGGIVGGGRVGGAVVTVAVEVAVEVGVIDVGDGVTVAVSVAVL